MKTRFYKYLTTLTALLLLLPSCTKEQFSTKKSTTSSTSTPVNTYTSGSICADKTEVRPPVDFLFLWDNTSSQTYVSESLKKALSNIVYSVSERFDAHFLLSPLIRSSADPININSFLVATSNNGLSSSALSMLVDKSLASSILQNIANTPVGSSEERGFTRARELISNNRTNGIFRNSSYTIIVTMSNGDIRIFDNGFWSVQATQNYVNSEKALLLSLRDSLQSLQLRFMSIVAQSEGCEPNFKKGNAYMTMSSYIYSAPYYTYGTAPSDQNGKQYFDSYNLCGANYLYLFDGINNAIQTITLKHKYDYWPVNFTNFDPNSITVTKYSGSTPTELIQNGTNGFSYVGYQTNRNTRYEPTAGEPYTGYMIKLNGTGKITYPDCLVVNATSPTEYWGYVYLGTTRPYTSSIVLTINGVTIPQSTTNGWQYVDYLTSQNVKVLSPSQPDQPGNPQEVHTGYFLKLYGTAIYSNSSTHNVSFDPMQ